MGAAVGILDQRVSVRFSWRKAATGFLATRVDRLEDFTSLDLEEDLLGSLLNLILKRKKEEEEKEKKEKQLNLDEDEEG